MQKTLTEVRDPKPWKDKGHFVDGKFSDGVQWSILVFGEKAKADAVVAQLRPLVGKPGDFETEEKTLPSGEKKINLVNWPGKAPAAGGKGPFSGRGGGWKETFRDTREAFDLQAVAFRRRDALQMAVTYASRVSTVTPTPDILTMADTFDEWLAKGRVAAPAKNGAPEVLKELEAALTAANAERKTAGKRPIDPTTIADAILVRAWPNKGFKTRADLPNAIGEANLRKLVKAIDACPLNFENETTLEEAA